MDSVNSDSIGVLPRIKINC